MWGASRENPMSHFINSISSYDSNVMLAAVISLLVVILFVLLLHIYAKWFLSLARHRRRSSSVSVSHVLLPSRFHHFPSSIYISSSPSPEKGLDPSIIASIPMFIYREEEHQQRLECVICLSIFEEDEVGRSLTKCGHSFHVDCIDMWLHCHTNCPICRAPVRMTEIGKVDDIKSAEALEEIMIDASNDSESEIRLENSNSGVVNCDPLSSSSSSSCSSLGCSLKRMLSRSRSENKVFASTNNNTELGV